MRRPIAPLALIVTLIIGVALPAHASVSYTVPTRGAVTVAIYDLHGARVATLLDHAYTMEWDGRATNGATVSSGVYFARIEHASGTRTKKMVMLK